MKQFFSILAIIFTILLFTACENKNNSTPNTTIEEEQTPQEDTSLSSKYYGKWAYVNTGEEITIISTSELNITDVEDDPNLILITEEDTSSYLIRSGLARTTINGTLQVISDSLLAPSNKASSFAGIGNINIILSNVLDARIKEETLTEPDGSFTTTTLPTGTYNLTASDEDKNIEATVDIVNQDNDIGIYKLTGEDLNNFKAELILNEKYIVSDGAIHEATLRIHNISQKIGYGLSFDISLNNNTQLISFTEDSENALGSLRAQSYKDIPVSFAFNTLSSNMQVYGINVTINDALGNQWIDTFSFNVHKAFISVLVSTKSAPIKGYIRNPISGELLQINTTDGKIILPLMPEDKPYTMVLSNPSFEDETVYSIGVNAEPLSFSGFKNTSAHEPNNNEALASSINSSEAIVSYLHATDIDFFKIITLENTEVNTSTLTYTNATSLTAPVSAPTGISASDGTVTDNIRITWSDTSNATYYEVYQADDSSANYELITNDVYTTSTDVNSSVTSNFIDAQVYYFKLRGCNAIGCSPFSYVNSGYYTNVVNTLPLAYAGEDQNVTGGEILLNASLSSDADGSIVSYRWLESSVELSTQESFSKTFSKGVHELAVIVTDDRGGISTDTIRIIVNNAPTFTSNTIMSIDENTFQVGSIQATDLDNDTLAYALISGDIDTLTLNSSSGLLEFKSGNYPDYESRTSYSLVISVTDGIQTTLQNLTININNIVDVVPIFSGISTFNMPENTPAGDIVANLSFLAGDSSITSYTILNVVNDDILQISTDGEISLKAGLTFDFETYSTYNLNVIATNSSGDSNLVPITINITDIYEAPIILTDSNITMTESFIKVTTILVNNIENKTLNYTITSGDDSSLFDINTSTGALSFKTRSDFNNPLDNDTNNVYNLGVSVNYVDTTNTVSKDINITITQIQHNGTTYSYVVSPDTNRTWLDKNLGDLNCSEVTSCFGDYYQWGRDYDEHQFYYSSLGDTSISISDTNNTQFIANKDWASDDYEGITRSQRWSNTDGSSICPAGYRVPTITELELEMIEGSITNALDADISFLNLITAGMRDSAGRLTDQDIGLWSTSYEVGTFANALIIYSSGGYTTDLKYRGEGKQVRCIQD